LDFVLLDEFEEIEQVFVRVVGRYGERSIKELRDLPDQDHMEETPTLGRIHTSRRRWVS